MLKKTLILCAAVLALASCAFAEDKVIQLPEPQREGGAPLLNCLAGRSSYRDFADSSFSLQELSNLLWAAGGVNRPDEGKLVYPTAMNVKDLIIYAVTAEGVYRFDPQTHSLTETASGDFRADTGKQPYVSGAAVCLVYVQDTNAWNSLKIKADKDGIIGCGFIHAGSAAQNASLYIASQGWGGVVRTSFDQEKLSGILGLTEGQIVKLTQSIGFRK